MSIPVYDIRDYIHEAPAGIYTYGGFLGEVILSLFCIQSHVLSKPENAGFKIDTDATEAFLRDLFVEGINPGIAYIKVSTEPS